MPPIRSSAAALAAACCILLSAAPALAVTPNGRLQIIHLDVGQGDGAVIISPLGQVVMIDDGVSGNPTPASGVQVPQQLQALGVTFVDHHFASHYHSDHIGLFKTIFGVNGVATLGYAWDRGASYTTQTYFDYVGTAGSKRRTMAKNQVITLDSLSAHPVTIKCVDLNGAGVTTTEENSSSLQLKVSYGEFDMSFGGDTPGQDSGEYLNIETPESFEIGPIEVYKVHHHGSVTSSQTDWLNAAKPKIAVVSCGNGNSYHHPTSSAMSRIHAAGTHVYWTETGTGVAPLAGWDKVSNGQVVISATWEPGGVDTIRGTGFADTFTNSGQPAGTPVVAVVSPNGGEDWKAASVHSITWNATDDVAVTSVDLAYSTDGGTTYPNTIATAIANSGAYAWTVPAFLTTNVRVRATAHDGSGNATADASDANFRISAYTITATAGANGGISPSGSSNVVEGGSKTYTMNPTAGYGVANVLVDGATVGAMSAYSFTNVNSSHTINVTFVDTVAPAVQVMAPNGGEAFGAGNAVDITWNAADNVAVDSVRIEFSAGGYAGPWSVVAAGLANSGTYSWTVPDQSTDSGLVRVVAFDHVSNTGVDASDGAFHVLGSPLAVGADAPVLALAPVAPNPARTAAMFRFSLPAAGPARLELIDVTGRHAWVQDGDYAAGAHSWRWDGRDSRGAPAGAGIYFVRLVTRQGTRTERFVLVR